MIEFFQGQLIRKPHIRCYFLVLIKIFLCFFTLFQIFLFYAKGQKINISSSGTRIKLDEVLSKQGVIWGFDFLSRNLIIFTERKGKIKILDLKSKKIHQLQNLPQISPVGQGGLMDILLDPLYSQNQWIYITYSISKNKKYSTRLSRFRIKNYRLSQLEVLFTAEPFSKQVIHFGSRIAFDHKGFVYVSIGDRGDRMQAQNLKNHHGTIIRLHSDGSIPLDNPFVQDKKKKKEIWSYGHRNPQGLVFNFKTNELWESEHGPRGGDEINLIEKGKNYGWPKASYGVEYFSGRKIGSHFLKGTVQPIKYYVPSIAPSGMEIYSGKVFPKWKDHFFLGSLKFLHLNKVVIENGMALQEERLLNHLRERIRSIKESPEGLLYFSTDSGRLFRLSLLE